MGINVPPTTPSDIPVTVAEGGTGSPTAAAAYAAIKQAATTSATGATELATLAENDTGTSAAVVLTPSVAVTAAPMKSPDFPAAAADTNNWRFSPPFAGAQVKAITVGAIGTAPTAGTVAFTKGVAAGGNTLLSAATYTLSELSDNALTPMTLTGTAAYLQGGLTDGFVMTVVNTDGPIFATVTWGKA